VTRARAAKLAINRLRERRQLDSDAVTRFLERFPPPVVEGSHTTFLHRGEADGVAVRHRVVGLPDPLPMRRIAGTDLWYASVELPEGSRIEYQLEVSIEGRHDRFNDPLNPRRASNPFGESSVCYGYGYEVPDWTQPDPDAREGELIEVSVRSSALRRTTHPKVYLPARFRRTNRYPVLIVHDGSDFLNYSSAKTVLDNLIHRMDVAELIAVFIDPGNRLVEYANNAAHARYIDSELVPYLEDELPLAGVPISRCLMGSSFGGIAALSTAVRNPGRYGSLLLQSASFVFTDIGTDHGGGEVFDPVVRFVNRYRANPSRPVDRLFASCGVYEPLIVGNRSMMPVFSEAGLEVRYVESRDGHNWESWRDRLRDGLSWVFPGPAKFVYE
jgi:enterochelin esterase-like enzyme